LHNFGGGLRHSREGEDEILSIDDKKATLKKGAEYNRANATKIRFDPNIPVTVIFPEDWHKHFKQETRESRDNPEETYVANVFEVKNPNSEDPERWQVLEASEKLYSEISTILEQSIEQSWNGPIIAKITKKVTGGNPYGQWSVQGQPYKEEVK